MTDLLLYGDCERSPALRHEVPVSIGDPFLFAEAGGGAFVVTSSLESARIRAVLPAATVIDMAELGLSELMANGLGWPELMRELTARAVARLGVRTAVVPGDFPVGIADRLRADGVVLTVDDATVDARRRVKAGAELAGVRRAQRAAEAGMAAAAAVLRAASAGPDGMLVLDGAPLTAEQVRAALRAACAEHGAPAPADVTVASVRQGFGHDPGTGPLPAHLPIQVDLWPQDEATACYADMTRTFVVGDITDAVRAQETLVRDAFEAAIAAVRPGVTGQALHGLVCDRFEAAGFRTQRTGPGEDPEEGFQFSLGHGVGLQVHEEPALGINGREPLIAGDVLAIEPGLWDRHLGGVRFEDLLLVTEDGCERLTDYPYDLAP